MNNTFPSFEKLKSKKQIDLLFTEGNSCSNFPIKLIYTSTVLEDEVPLKVGVSVSKRSFKNAVDRNHLKRLLREAYRLNKHVVYNKLDQQYLFMFLYLGKQKLTFQELNEKMEGLLQEFIEKNA